MFETFWNVVAGRNGRLLISVGPASLYDWLAMVQSATRRPNLNVGLFSDTRDHARQWAGSLDVFCAGFGGATMGRALDLAIVVHPNRVPPENGLFDYFKTSIMTRLEPEATAIVISGCREPGGLISRIAQDDRERSWLLIEG